MSYLVFIYSVVFILYFITFFVKDDTKRNIGIVVFYWIALGFFIFQITFQKIGGDPYRYVEGFKYIGQMSFNKMLSIPLHERYSDLEFGFRIFDWIIYHIYSNGHFFIFTVLVLFFLIFFKAIDNLYKGIEKYYILISYLLFPYFIAYVESGKRQGLAMALMLLSISYFFKKNDKKALIALFAIPLFHYGTSLVIPFILLWRYIKNSFYKLKIATIIYLISIFSAITHLNEKLKLLLAFIISHKISLEAYISNNGAFANIHYKTGFRLDFTIFSLFPVFLYIIFYKKINSEKKEYINNWIVLYLLLNSIFQFLCFIPFNDRLAAFSWFVWPIIIYEILKAVYKKYVIIYILLMLFFGVILLSFYTSKYFTDLGMF